MHDLRAEALSVLTETPSKLQHIKLWEQPEPFPECTVRFLGRTFLLESVLSGQAEAWLAVWTALSRRVALCHSLGKMVLLFNSIFDFIFLTVELGVKHVL